MIDYSGFISGLTCISEAYAGVNGTNHNLEILVDSATRTQNPVTKKYETGAITTVSYFAQVTEKRDTSEQNETIPKNRIYIEGNILVENKLNVNYQERFRCIFSNNDDSLVGYFYPLIDTQSALGNAIKTEKALGQKISGWLELNQNNSEFS